MVICHNPAFDRCGDSWSPCVHCGRGAWDHEQADPLNDIRNMLRGIDAPPTMRRLDPHAEDWEDDE